MGKKRCVQNGAHTVDEDRELEASLECRETIEISIPLIRGSRGFAVSAVEKKPLRSSANETRVCTGEILAELERYSDD